MGQISVVGEASVEVLYAFNAIDIEDEQTYIDLQVLRVGKDLSKYYSRFLELNDSLREDFIRKSPNAEGVPNVPYANGRNRDYWSEYQFTDIFTEKGQHTFYARMPRYMERYNGYWSEPVCSQEWELYGDSLTILGYPCQRATCHWRGRYFEAWFAPDIPVSLGPWTFAGLPGLILKLYDLDKLYTFEAVGIHSGSFPITKSDYKDFRSDTREHIRKLQIAANRDYLKTGGARDRKTGQLKSKPHPYEPLERE